MVAARSPNVHDSPDSKGAEINAAVIEGAARERQALERECAALRGDQAVLALGLSHDLRTPLRAIESFSYLLEQQGTQLDDQGRDHLRRIRDASARMTRLLSRMQAYLQVGTASMRTDDVDVSLLVDWCIAELRDAAPDREAHVDIGPGLRTRGDERLLKAALQELLHNAWQFTPADRPVHIRVDGERAEDRFTLRVHDRGEGFDPALAARLGEPFQRLYAGKHPEGCGLGLAIARRIAERHGGTLHIDGKPGEGVVASLVIAYLVRVGDDGASA